MKKIYARGLVKCGLYKQVVFIYVVLRAVSTVHCICAITGSYNSFPLNVSQRKTD